MRNHAVQIVTLFVISLFAITNTYAGKHIRKPAANDPVTTVSSTTSGNHQQAVPLSTTSVALDTMPNSFSMFDGAQQPVAYDPYSNVVVLDCRHNAGQGSGTIFYRYSTDGGATWSADQGPTNGTQAYTGRYPSVGLENPTHGSDPTSATSVIFGYPELVAGAFGGAVFGLDVAVGADAFTATLDTSRLWSSSFYVFPSNDNSNVVLAGCFYQSSNDIALAKSTDAGATFGTFSDPVGLDSALYGPAGGQWDWHGWDYVDGAYYFGIQALQPAAFLADSQVIDFMSVKSTDKGATWGTPDICRPSQISALNGLVNYSSNAKIADQEYDYLVDAQGTPHFFAVFADTVHSTQGVYELTKVSGAWTATKVASLTQLISPGGSQRYNEIEAAKDSSGTTIAVKWIDVAAATDSIPDIYAAARTLTGSWSGVQQLTNTSQTAGPSYCFSHMASRLGPSGAMYIAWSSHVPDGIATSANTGDKYVLEFLSGAKVTAVHGAVDNLPATYALHQNYPNPFNPTTRIEYSVPRNGYMTLKVFSVLGEEVSTLFSGMQKAGDHFATFDASRFASGVYFYRLQAGTFSTTKKMVLMK